jgi:hypothetical protein
MGTVRAEVDADGAMRLNVSKCGIGAAVGVKGARVGVA